MAEPDATIVSFRCKKYSCYQLADAMEKRGFFVEKQSNPESIHMTLMLSHCNRIDEIIEALKNSIEEMNNFDQLYENGSKAVYGMMASIPDEAIV
jgi:sphinganine-1-phosphate aldolase